MANPLIVVCSSNNVLRESQDETKDESLKDSDLCDVKSGLVTGGSRIAYTRE